MKDQKHPKLILLTRIYLSFFGSGYAKFAPGTVGSLATIPLIYLLYLFNIGFLTYVLIVVIMTILACIMAEYIQKVDKSHDPQWIVMDEVVGMLITWMFVFNQFDFYSIAATFILFRLFDIIKIWPASFFDKKITHGSGTILDDVISAIYAGLSLLLINYFL